MKPNKIPIFHTSEGQEPHDLTETVGTSPSVVDPTVVLAPGVPPLGTPEFAEYLEKWHKRHKKG